MYIATVFFNLSHSNLYKTHCTTFYVHFSIPIISTKTHSYEYVYKHDKKYRNHSY